MKKLLIAILLVLLLAVSIFPAAAAPTDELTDLARYFPANTAMFAAQRIDNDYLYMVNKLTSQIDERLGGELLNGETLLGALDQMAQEVDSAGDFKSTFRPWLGDTVAVGISDFMAAVEDDYDSDVPVVIALTITDSRAAELFIDNNKPPSVTKEQLNEGILYRPSEPNRYDPTFFVGEDVMLIRPSSLDPMSIVPAFDASLADNADFQAAIDRLPQAEYDSVAYFDYASLAPMGQQMQRDLEDQGFPMMCDYEGLFNALGAAAMGGVIVDTRAFVLDVSVSYDETAFAALGYKMGSYSPIDFEFTNKLPAETMALIHSTNIGPNLLLQWDALQMMGEQASGSASGMAITDKAITFMRLAFDGLAGMTMEEAFGWMTGDAVMYLNIVPYTGSFADELPVIPDFGAMVEVTDDDAANALVEAVPQMLFELGLETEEQDGKLVLPLLGNMFGDHSLDGLLVNNGDVLLDGTRPGVEAILAGNGGLTDTPAFQYASRTFLPDTQSLAYINMAPLTNLAGSLAEMTGDSDLEQLAAVLSLVESASVTSHYEANVGNARFVLNLAGQ